MALDHYLTLGRSGLRVSPLCLGTMTFGDDLDWGSSAEASTRILDRYIDAGGNFIDTANSYMFGHSERIIGDHLKRDPPKRHRLVIGTKFHALMRAGDPNAGGTGRKNVVQSCEESLRRLGTDYIDLYWMHTWDALTPAEETLRALDDLVRSGKVRYIGFSDTPAWKVAQSQVITQFRGWAPLIALQIEYSLLERTSEGEILPMAQEFGMGVVTWGPLKSGALSGKYGRDPAAQPVDGRRSRTGAALDERTHAVVALVGDIATELRAKPAQVAIAWLLRQPSVTSPILGARTLPQLEENLGALELKLSSAQLERLTVATQPSLDFPADFVRRSPRLRNPGISINGETPPASPIAPRPDGPKY